MSLDAFRNKILPLKEQARVRNEWLKIRLEEVIPEIMARENMDVWLVICREYNEDPVIMSMLPEPVMSARRRTILAFCRNEDDSVDRLTIDRYGHGDYYQSVWEPEEESQYECLARILKDRDPQTIGLNTSANFAFGDGLSYIEHQQLAEALDDELMSRTGSAERLCLGWLETRTDQEIMAYGALVEIGHAIIAEAFSTKVVHPGVTSTDDIIWWMRQTMQDMGLQAWFHPDVLIQAPGQTFDAYKDPNRRRLIQPGDLLWCDMGFKYLGFCTDQQEVAYVLKPDERDAPDGLKQALANSNRMQDIHMEEMQIGRTGNEVLQATVQRANDEGLNVQVYSHPLGFHGHAAGPTIGLWDQQDGVPGKGDYEVFDNTCYSIELNALTHMPEWDQTVRVALEQDAVMHNGTMRWLDSRQSAFYLIG